MGVRGGRRSLAGAVALVGLLVPVTAAQAQDPPAVTTGAASNIAPTTVTLNGSVNPRGGATTYFFQYGTTSLYGATTSPTSAGSGRRRVSAVANVAGLVPNTRYHYRLVAQKGRRIVRGKDRTFRTRRQPLAITLAGSPNPVRSGGATTLTGVVTGTGNAGRQVVLQANPFPYTQGFVTVANPQVIPATGAFAFPVLSVPVNTQYRALLANRPEIVSPTVTVGTTVRVTTNVRVRRGRRSGVIRFRGTITPAVDGSELLIQKFRNGAWRNIGSTFARNAGSTLSRYRKRVRQRSGGRFRVVANLVGEHVPSLGRPKRVRVRG